MTHCTRIRTSREPDEVAAGARTFEICRRHRPRRPHGPIHLTDEQRALLGRLDESVGGHRPARSRVVARIRSRPGRRSRTRRAARPLAPSAPTTARQNANARRRSSLRRHGPHRQEEGILRLSGVRPVRSARTAVAALASLTAHRSPLWRPRP
jgi:hypothetical protein